MAAPDWEPARHPRQWALGIGLLWVLGLGGALVLARLQIAFGDAAGYENTIDDDLDDMSAASQLLLVAVVAPLVEETIYRLPLTRRLNLPLIALSLVGAGVLLSGSNSAVALAFAVAGIAVLAGWGTRSLRARATTWWAAHARWPVWVFALWFGAVHLVNFDVDWGLAAVAAAPFVVSPQIWLGLMFTVARVRYGWWAGLVLHAVHNLVVWTVSTVAGG